MDSREVKIKCKRCYTETAMKDMKYDRNGKDLICPDCYNSVFSAERRTPKKDPGFISFEKREVWCTKCRYKFKIKKDGDLPKACPYCGAKDKVEEFVKLSAEDILKEASDEIYG